MAAEENITFQNLFDFYYEEYKPLYCDVSAANKLPQEALLETAAAFDHIARHFLGEKGGTETECAGKALSHLKRACLDMYKLEYVDAKESYDRLCRLPINLVDNGDFERILHALFAETRKMAVEARCLEGQKAVDSPAPAFEKWKLVYINCKRIASNEFLLNPKIGWARLRGGIKENLGIFLAILGLSLGC